MQTMITLLKQVHTIEISCRKKWKQCYEKQNKKFNEMLIMKKGQCQKSRFGNILFERTDSDRALSHDGQA